MSLLPIRCALATSIFLWVVPQAQADDIAPDERVETMGAGACLARGLGTAGIYLKYDPVEHVGLEAAAGAQKVQINFSTGTTSSYYPLTAALKARYNFLGRTRKFNPGIEAGLLYSGYSGVGAELSSAFTFRINHHLHLDANAGIGYYPDRHSQETGYVSDKTGVSRSNIYLSTTPLVLYWGVGIAFML